jgi:hypothetical protein
MLRTNAEDYCGARAGTLLITQIELTNGLLTVQLTEHPAGWKTTGDYQMHESIDFARLFD